MSNTQPKRRGVGIVDTTPRRLPPEPHRLFVDHTLDPGLTCREIRRRMISMGFRMTLAAIAKDASRIRREHGVHGVRGRRLASGVTAAELPARPKAGQGRVETIAQAYCLILSVTLGPSEARDAVARMAEIAGVSGGPR